MNALIQTRENLINWMIRIYRPKYLELNSQLLYYKERVNRCVKEITELKQRLENMKPSKAETYWESKHPQVSVLYKGRSVPMVGDVSIDVRNFYNLYDSVVPTVTGETNDDKALAALKYIRRSIKYVSDTSSVGLREFWQFAYETMHTKQGDCEDGAILMANIMLKSGIPYWRIRLCAGDVQGGGHAYVTYCRETDNNWVVLDWCYWYNTKTIKDRPLHKEKEKYYGVWFSWTQKSSYMKPLKETIPDEYKVKK